MKTLNRPMFRYGGPIKEGIMSGIREPKRNGGSMMGNNEGPRRAALVGNPVYPQTDGRENHYLNFALQGLAAAGPALVRYGKPLLQGAKRIFGKTTTKPAPFSPIQTKITGGYNEYGPANYTRKILKDTATKSGGVRGAENVGKLGGTEVFTPNWLGRDPLVKSIGAIGKGIFNPTSKGIVGKVARFATAPTSIISGVAYYMWPDGKERTAPPPNKKDGVNTPSGNNPFGYKDDLKTTPEGEKALTAEEVKAAENKLRREQMDTYREIMDIKGMNKDAAYKSLIDASKIIQEGGNLKKQIKDGSLIANITQAASKRFDKVSDTDTALKSLVAKGEIQNEIDKEKNALENRKTNLQIQAAEKTLAGTTIAEEISAYRLKNEKNPSGRNLAGILQDKRVDVIDIADTVKVDEHIKGGGDAVSFMESIVLKNLEKGTQITPGVYVVKDVIIQIDENGKVTKARP
jgi:hypothetical protein